MEMFCRKCGTQVEDGAVFCGNCGHRMNVTDNHELEENFENSPNIMINMASNAASAAAAIGSAATEKVGEAMEAFKVKTENYREESASRKAEATAQMNKATSGYIEQDESVLATLGNGYGTNILFGSLKKVNATLTDKRVYFQGTMFYGMNLKSMTKVTKTQIIDLEDITGTGFIYSKMSWVAFIVALIIYAISEVGLSIFFIILNGDYSYYYDYDYGYGYGYNIGAWWMAAIPALVYLIIKFIFSRKMFFFVEYAGGLIQFNAKLLGLSDVADFHMLMRRAKADIKKKQK